MRTKRLAMWPKPPWCISLKALKKIAGYPYTFKVDFLLNIFGFWYVICHFDFVRAPPPRNPLTYTVFANGVVASTGGYPPGTPGTPIAFGWFSDPQPIT